MQALLDQAIAESLEMLPRLAAQGPALARLGEAMLRCWRNRGKVLIAGNGGSMSDAMHLAEELIVRFKRNRRALAAMALSDPAALTCAGNDFGYETVFERQIQGLGNPGDILIIMTTSGRSPNLLRAISAARQAGMTTAAFLGGTTAPASGQCDIELTVPSIQTARIQEGHKLLFHTLCEWIDARVEE